MFLDIGREGKLVERRKNSGDVSEKGREAVLEKQRKTGMMRCFLFVSVKKQNYLDLSGHCCVEWLVDE